MVRGSMAMAAMHPYIPVSIPAISGRAATGGRSSRFMPGFKRKSILYNQPLYSSRAVKKDMGIRILSIQINPLNPFLTPDLRLCLTVR